MRYGIFSDVHGNLEAFRAALDFYKEENIDEFIYLGDIVGYGTNPNECISLLKSLDPTCVVGNHDWAVIGKCPIDHFSHYAKQAMLWTKLKISRESLQYLENFTISHARENFFCAHGSLDEPEEFYYILEVNDARRNFPLLTKMALFIGHTHKMGIFSLENKNINYIKEYEVKLKSENKYIINVGSVGQPRDRDPRACVCMYDDKTKIVKFERLEYDNKTAAEKILNEGLPPRLAERLFIG